MGIKNFVHLHVHSHYSLLEAPIRPADLVKRAVEFGMTAVAMTDLGNMFGALEFYFACKSQGIKPILGLEVYLAPGSRFEKGENNTPNRRLVLLATNHEGYLNLCRISTLGYKEGFYYKPRVDYEVLKRFPEGIICLSGGLAGEIPWTFIHQGEGRAEAKILSLKEIFCERFYLETNRTGVGAWNEINPFLRRMGAKHNISCVATNDVFYLNHGDHVAQEVLICIGSNRTLQDEKRYRLGTDQFYFKSSAQMNELFSEHPEEIENTLKIAEACRLEIKNEDEKGHRIYHLPSFPVPDGRSVKEFLRHLAEEGLHKRFSEKRSRGESPADETKYLDRLNYELNVIDEMGFNGYFLIVQDFINWAKAQSIPVGPGRGSGAGSLVAYSLRITDLDPLPYNLIFERFLNPERVSMPDFDVDFCQEGRQRVIEYVIEKYGEQSVSQIITYGKLQARAAIRDVGRVMGMTFSEVDVISKLMPERLGITLDEAIREEPRIRELMESDPKIQTLMDLARKIEGLVRHAGIHAAGVIIADGDILNFAPLYRGVEGENVIQYDMGVSEKIGLIKFDFLGLKTLTHIAEALRLIENNKGKKISTVDISLNDSGIYALMTKGDTAGVFQFEGEGITDLIRKAKPTCFEDIVAINALYRPGPMEMIPEYLSRKHGEVAVRYLFPQLEDILKETYGITVYQEQVMRISNTIANYSLGEADLLRKAMGKKIPEVMMKQKERFLKGAAENKLDLDKAGTLFDQMAEFAKYGFNKSHAAAYCVIAAQTAFLKNYYPVEFFAALLSTEMGDTDKVVKYVKDARQRGIEVMAPDVNYSEFKFTVKGSTIYFGLGAIKGVGEAAVENILAVRSSVEKGTFQSLEDFFERVDLRKVNKKTVECLIKAGAFDGFGFNRAELFDGFSDFVQRAERVREERESGQGSLFTENESQQEKVNLVRKEEWSRALRLSYEKEVLGFYLSDHPLKGLEKLVTVFGVQLISDLAQSPNKSMVRILGLVSSLREIITKKATRMAFVQMEDLSGSVELVVFPNTFSDCEGLLKSEQSLVVSGKFEKDEGGMKILAEKVESTLEILKRTKEMVLQFHSPEGAQLEVIQSLLERFPGETQVQLEFNIPEVNRRVSLDVKSPRGVSPHPDLLDQLQRVMGDSHDLTLRL